jgi:hypothetical protein
MKNKGKVILHLKLIISSYTDALAVELDFHYS